MPWGRDFPGSEEGPHCPAVSMAPALRLSPLSAVQLWEHSSELPSWAPEAWQVTGISQ